MDEQKYSKNFLTDVIFELRFPPILELMDGDSSHLGNFQRTMQEGGFSYNNVNKVGKIQLPQNLNSFSPIDPKTLTSWIFFNKPAHENPSKTVELLNNTLIIIFKEYKSFNDFLTTLKLVFKALKKYPVMKTEYIGLRYINQIILDGKPDDWENIINNDLICNHLNLNNTPKRFMHSIEIDEGDYDIQFQYGQFNKNYPNPISEREYVLDYTCRCFESKNFNEIIDTTDQMHRIISNLFEKSIGEGLRGEMSEH